MDPNERMGLAFLYHYAEQMVMADNRLDKAEVRALEGLNRELIAADLMASDGTLTPAFVGLRDAAVATLASAVPEADRRDLLERLRYFAEVDGHVDDSELQTLSEAADVLCIALD